jgi:hypothetical protein
MRHAVATLLSLVVLLVAAVSTAAADPLSKPAYTLQCGSNTYSVVSPDHAATGSDVNSTSQFIAVVGNVPTTLLRFCTASEAGGGEVFSGLFLITPAH